MRWADQGGDVLVLVRPGGNDSRHQRNPKLETENAGFMPMDRDPNSIFADLRTGTGLQLNPKLVYCSISGGSTDGTYARETDYASTVEVTAELMSLTGARGRPPVEGNVSTVGNLPRRCAVGDRGRRRLYSRGIWPAETRMTPCDKNTWSGP